MKTKKCTGPCGLEKPEDYFELRKDTGRHRNKCMECIKEDKKQYRNKLSLNPGKKEELSILGKEYKKTNKEKISKQNMEYRELHKEERLEYSKAYVRGHRKETKEYKKEYIKTNKTKINSWMNEYHKTRRRKDPAFRMRRILSYAINSAIKSNGYSKNNISCLDSLGKDYPSKIKSHIEFLFEPWMTWENQGKYNSKTWDDNDPTTWVWNIDHIIPHSFFKYTSSNDDECRKAWSLDNLRPLSAKENIIKGNRISEEVYNSTMIKILESLK